VSTDQVGVGAAVLVRPHDVDDGTPRRPEGGDGLPERGQDLGGARHAVGGVGEEIPLYVDRDQSR
jgi:hypothetical protein